VDYAVPVSRPSPPVAPPARPLAASLDAPATAAATSIGALLVGSALLRIGAVGATASIQFDLTDLAHGRPNNAIIGIVGGTQAISEMAFALILARFADRFGRRRFLIGGPLLGALALLLLAGATSPAQLAAARVIEGVGAAAFVPTALGTIAAATTEDSRSRANASGAFEGATVAGFAGGFVVGPFAYHWLHRGSFLVLATFYLAAAVVCWRLVPRVNPLPVSPLRVVARAILGRGPIRTFIPAWLAVNGLVGAWLFNLAALLKRSPDPSQTLIRHFDERVIGLMLLGWVVVLLVGITLWIPVLRRLGGPLTMRRAVPGVFVVAGGLFAINHLSLAAAPLLLPIVVVGIIIQAGFGPAAVAYLADCSEDLAADRSALMAFYTVTLAGGGALGSVVGGALARVFLFDGLVLMALVLGVVAYATLGSVIRYEAARGNLGPPGRRLAQQPAE